MHASPTSKTLSKADIRREEVLSSAIVVFANGGYLGMPVTAVAERAGIVQASLEEGPRRGPGAAVQPDHQKRGKTVLVP
jgi:hypothetical protein